MNNQKGLTILDVLVAVFIIAVGLAAVLALLNYTLRAAQTSKMGLIASGLAQEGVEIVRSVRDAQADWTGWFASPLAGDWQVAYDSSSFSIPDNTSAPLKYDAATGLYQYATGSNTLFYRKVSISKISSDQLKVIVDIKWTLGSMERHLIVEDRLWRWR